MKCFIKRTIILGSIGISLPFMVLATTAFQGPSATPPSGNVPGVIWNMAGTGQTQTGALIDVDNIANFGISSGINDIDGDLGLESGKAFRVDYNGSANYNIGNWYGGINKPFSFNLFGDLYAYAIDPYTGAGLEGRIQADKFCFNPGNPTDCITSWSGVGGDYVLKTGDTMTGALKIYNTNYGLLANGSSTGVIGNGDTSAGTGGNFYGGGYGIKAVGGSLVGGDFEGPWGVYSRSTLGTGIAVYGWGGDIGGQFYSKTSGVSSTAYGANSIGVRGLSTGNNSIGVKGTASQTNGTGGIFDGYTGISAIGVGSGGFFQGTGAGSVGGNFLGTNTGVSSTGGIVGVLGESNQNNGIGISGKATKTGGLGGYFYGAKNAIGAISPGGTAISATGSSVGIEAQITGGAAWDKAFYGWGGSFGGLFIGSQSGVRGANSVNNSVGNLGTVSGYGADGKGSVAGVHGEYAPNTTNYGELGTASYGVHGQGSTAGLYGIDTDSGSNGYIGNGSYGGAFYGTSYGVNGEGPTLGIRAKDTDSGVYTYLAFGDWGLYTPYDAYVGGSLGVNTAAPTADLSVNGTANKTGGGSWAVFSDIRLKDLKGEFNYGLNEIGKLQPVKFSYKKNNPLKYDSKPEYIGLVAQEVEKVIPEAVTEVNGYKMLDQDPIIWAMLNSIKELKAQNEELKARIEVLENK
ncbi:MAG: tail fiber domain-containing protein [Patescibacteria group bacterium]